MKNKNLIFALLLISFSETNSQVIEKPVLNNYGIFFQNRELNYITMFFIPSPSLIVENKKAYFGLSKELSLGFGRYAEHRLTFEYTYIFRDNNNSHYRLGLNHDLYPGSIMNLSVGGGYFTDGEKNGIYPQISVNTMTTEKHLYFSLYVKSRVTFSLETDKSSIYDMSLGFSIGLAPFGAKPRKGFEL